MSRGPRFVLDTHTALWAQLDVKRLGRNARTALAGLPPSALAVCDVTLTEVARLLREGRIVPAAAGPEAWLDAFGLCFAVLPVTTRVAWTAAAFEWSHRDPCDRHILATAFVHGLPLVTVDPVIAAVAPQVGVEIVW
jgi:PIN domain nuclease of toxin-antitoxin system